MKEHPFKAKDLVDESTFVEIEGGQTVETACQVSCLPWHVDDGIAKQS